MCSERSVAYIRKSYHLYLLGGGDPSGNEDEVTVFTQVTYLGSATVNAPRSEMEINRNMQILNEQSQMVIPVTLVVPTTSAGTVMYV